MTVKTDIRTQPTQTRAQQRMDEILDAALEVAMENGYENLTTNHVAKAAKMSVGSLYRYFPNKQSIIYHLVKRWLDGMYYKAVHNIGPKLEDIPSIEVLISENIDLIFGPWTTSPAIARREKALRRAIHIYPELDDLESMQAQRFANLVADATQRFCPETPRQILYDNGIFIFSMDFAFQSSLDQGVLPTEALYRFKKAAISLFHDL